MHIKYKQAYKISERTGLKEQHLWGKTTQNTSPFSGRTFDLSGKHLHTKVTPLLVELKDKIYSCSFADTQ